MLEVGADRRQRQVEVTTLAGEVFRQLRLRLAQHGVIALAPAVAMRHRVAWRMELDQP